MTGTDVSDLEFARLAHPGRPDVELVTTLARRTVADLALIPPIDPGLLASFRGIVRVEQAFIPWAGCLLRDGDDLVVKVRATDGARRQRFTACHEIIHTYLPGFSLVPQYRCDPAAAPSSPSRDLHLETLCDVGASELLLPAAAFRNDTAGRPATLDTVEEMADAYQASLEATGRRYVSLATDPTLLLGLEIATAPRAPLAAPRLRVRWRVAAGKWPFIPKHKSAPDDSPLVRAAAGEVIDEITDVIGLSQQPMRSVRLSAHLYPYFDQEGCRHMRVIALMTIPPARLRASHG